MNKRLYRVSFAQFRKEIMVREGATIMEAARACGVSIESPCAGAGTCKKCKVRISADCATGEGAEDFGHAPEDKLFLACKTRVSGDLRVMIPDAARASLKILEAGISAGLKLHPFIKKVFLAVPEPSLKLPKSDTDRLKMALPPQLKNCEISYRAIKKLPGRLRVSKHKITAVFSGMSLIDIEEGDTTGKCYGIALDIGTTSVVASLADLDKGEVIALSSSLNRQTLYGYDVISRITYSNTNPEGLRNLQKEIILTINLLIKDLCRKSRVSPQHIYEMCVAGNTCMLHLLLGLEPGILALSPYVAVHHDSLYVRAEETGARIAPGGRVYLFPGISAFVGGDITAGILATGLHRQRKPSLFIDIGTNGEVVLCSSGRLLACSTAAGPAFEGMNISCGMRAEAGAIEDVSLDGDIYYKTIGDLPPRGICGSGLIDLVAELLKKGLVDRSGRYNLGKGSESGNEAGLMKRIERNEKGMRFLLVSKSDAGIGRDIYLSQRDIRELQLAKGAIFAGIRILLRELGLTEEDVRKVYIAGAFGYHLRAESLSRIGLIPPQLSGRITFVGNSSKTGAEMVLFSQKQRETARRISKKVNTIELTIHPGFEEEFVKALSFPAI